MNLEHYSVNSRCYTAYSPLDFELIIEAHKNYLFDLSYLGILSLNGEKSREFLQGQISCDVRNVNQEQMQQGALCNLKGRVLALLDVIDWNDLQLILPQDLINDTKASLSKTALFSKITLNNHKTYPIYGFYLQNPDDLKPKAIDFPKEPLEAISHENFYCYHLGNHLYIIILKPKLNESFILPFSQNGQWRGALAWHYLQLQLKHIEIYPISRGLFLPHRLGLHHSGYLNFNKGCYKGQEIIARTHYRAKQKHELKLFEIHTLEELTSGIKLFSKDGSKEIGELIDYCMLEGDRYLIAVSILIDHPEQVLFQNHQEIILLSSPS